jgi:hypothetical protein
MDNIKAFLTGMREFRCMRTFRFVPHDRRRGDWTAYHRYQAGRKFAHFLTFGYWE